jgi:hypothetical protein
MLQNGGSDSKLEQNLKTIFKNCIRIILSKIGEV